MPSYNEKNHEASRKPSDNVTPPEDKEVLTEQHETIPLPNENVDTDNRFSTSSKHKGLPFMDLFKNPLSSFGKDEIILVGLIFLLWQEKVEDEFLLIILIYLLISGSD